MCVRVKVKNVIKMSSSEKLPIFNRFYFRLDTNVCNRHLTKIFRYVNRIGNNAVEF